MDTEREWVKNNSNIGKNITLSGNCIFSGEMLDTLYCRFNSKTEHKNSFYTKKKQNGRPTFNWIFDLGLMASFHCCYCHKL